MSKVSVQASMVGIVLIALASLSNALGWWAVDWRSMGDSMLAGPNVDHWFGTNALGQDIMARVIQSTVNAFNFGCSVAFAAIALGSIAGLAAGYWVDGWIDRSIQALLATIESMPVYFLAGIAVIGSYASIVWVGAVLALAFSTSACRVIRVRTRELRDVAFIRTALALGVPQRRIVLLHLPPLLAPMVLMQWVITFAAAVKTEAVLEFLGLSDPNRIGFGTLLVEVSQHLMAGRFFSLVPTGLAFFGLVMLFQIVAEALAEADQ